MRIIKLETFGGNNINTVTKEAKEQSIKENAIVEFDFNGILCRVSEQTNIDLLLRDYGNSFLMGWKTIGTVCVDEYSSELLAEMKIKREEQEEKSRLQT